MNRQVPERPDGDLRAVSLQIELKPIEKGDLPVSFVQVLPLNEVQIRDQRENFNVTPLSVLSILAHFGSQSVDLAVDYDHGMYYGDNMEAAGWGEKIVATVPDKWQERMAPFLAEFGDRVGLMVSDQPEMWGVYVMVRWTPAAAKKIENREYRYISPVVFFDYSGAANYLWNAAIVNQPAIDGMDALAASVMRPREAAAEGVPRVDDNTPEDGEQLSAGTAEEGETEMPYLKNLAEALGIEPLADTEDKFDAEAFETIAIEKVAGLIEKNAEAETLASDYARVNVEVEEAREALAVETAKVEAFEAEKLELQKEKEALVIDGAIEDGKLAASQRDWAIENFDAFEKLLPTLADAPQGPPQGSDVNDSKEDELDYSALNQSERRDAIAKYAAEKGITFTEAFKELG